MTDITYLQQLRQTIFGEFYFGAMCHETKRRIAISPDASRGKQRYSQSGETTKLIGTGMTGALVSIMPVLVVLLGALGLTAWIGKLDYVLIPVFVAAIGLVIFAVVRRKRACPAKTTQSP
jgi:mercuric ion transport protein